MIEYLKRGFAHLLRGTIGERLRMEWYRYIGQKRLKRWTLQAPRNENMQARIQKGVQMNLYFDSVLSRLIYCGGFEERERLFLNAFLKPGDVFVDIGANIGLFALIAAHAVGYSGHVYAFEPCLKTYHRLLANIQLNCFSNVSCYQLALSDSVTQLDLNISLDGYDAWNSLGEPYKGNSFAVETVSSVTWDDFAQTHGLVGLITMIKIDVEGWETHVLLGGSKVFSRSDAPVLQIEFNEPGSRASGSNCRKLYHMLEDFGYQIFLYDAVFRKLIHYPISESSNGLNLIAAKNSEKIEARLRGKR